MSRCLLGRSRLLCWRKGEPGGWRKTLGKDIIGGKNEGQNCGEC